MGNLLSGKMVKWLKWPSDKQIVFILICVLVTAALAIDQNANLLQLVAIFVFVTFIGLIVAGWYESLWKLSLTGFVLFLFAVTLNEIMMPSNSYLWSTLVILSPIWIFLTFSLWIVPRQINENSRNLVQSGREQMIPRPGYKLSEFFKIIWVFFWVIVLLINASLLFLWLSFVDWEKVSVSLFTFQANSLYSSFGESILALDLLNRFIWVGLVVIFLVDSNRKDANIFYVGVGIVTAWQLVKIWLFYTYSYPYPEVMILLSFVLLFIGGALLLRAALNRPPREAEVALE